MLKRRIVWFNEKTAQKSRHLTHPRMLKRGIVWIDEKTAQKSSVGILLWLLNIAERRSTRPCFVFDLCWNELLGDGEISPFWPMSFPNLFNGEGSRESTVNVSSSPCRQKSISQVSGKSTLGEKSINISEIKIYLDIPCCTELILPSLTYLTSPPRSSMAWSCQ